MAILIHELMKAENRKMDLNIFATDLDNSALEKAREGTYSFESVKNCRYHLVRDYFSMDEEFYTVRADIRAMVSFSVFDMLDSKTVAPPESVFGSFDLVLCRNVLIYYNSEYQDRILEKVYRSMGKNGYLTLGEVETPAFNFRNRLKAKNGYCRIYQKT